MIVFYYVLPKPGTPRDKLYVLENEPESNEVLSPPPSTLALAIGDWQERFDDSRADLIDGEERADFLLSDCGEPVYALDVADVVTEELTRWTRQRLDGEVEFVAGLEELAAHPPQPIDSVLAAYRAACGELLRECQPSAETHLETVFDAADQRTLDRLNARRTQRARRRQRILELAPPCAAPGIVAVYSTKWDDATINTRLADPWAGDIGAHLPSRWLHFYLREHKLLPYVADVLINGRSWRDGSPYRAA